MRSLRQSTRLFSKRSTGLFLAMILLTLLATSGFAQVTSSSGTVFGTVTDQSGAVLPKASVTIIDPSIGVTRTAQSGASGEFVFPNLPRGTYTVTVEAAGFLKSVKTDIVLSSGDNQSAGVIALKVGTGTETVTVTADAAQLQLQTESGDRSDTITGQQLNDLAMNGRMIFDYIKVLPGIISTFNGAQSSKGGLASFNVNGARGGAVQLTVDGVTNVDSGCNCATQITINPDAIAEVKMLTSNFDAQYGKAAGGQMAIITKNGTNEFHGNLRWFHRNEGLNANNWFNDQTNALNVAAGQAPSQPKEKYRYNYFGEQIGGPVVIPGTDFNKKRDKVFFFFNEEVYRQLLPGGYDQTYVPTLAEIGGDFSKSTDGYGNPIVVKNPATGQPFSGNIVPSNMINTQVQNYLLKVLPRPNTVDPEVGSNGVSLNRYNYVTPQTTTHPRREDIGRLDYQFNDSERAFFTVINNSGQQYLPEGLSPQGISNFAFPGGMFLQEPGYNVSAHLTSTLSNTMVNDLTFGWTVNQQHIYSVNNQVLASKYGINIPLLYPVGADSPVPDMSFGGVNNQNGTWSYLGSLPWNNADTVINLNDNLTKIVGPHTFKAGIFVERSRKDQSSWGNANGTFNFSSNDNTQAAMGLQTGDPYANALLGYYTSFQQQDGRQRGFYRYTNVEFYAQDTYKVTRRLTLDYGMRFAWVQPQYDANNGVSYFDPSKWVASQAVRLYYRVPDGSGNAYDPVTGQVVNGSLYGTIVPGSGNPYNGMISAKDGGYAGGFMDRGIMPEPRLGFAYDVTGKGKSVLRGGVGMTHDRFQGNPIYNLVVGNPPNSVDPTFHYGTLNSISTLASNQALGTVNAIGFQGAGKVPTIYSYSLTFQQDLGWGTMLDIAYVGNQSRHLSQKYNLNAIPYGTTFLASSQDPAKYGSHVVAPETWIPQQYKDAGLQYMGDNAYDSEFLRKYQGYNDIEYWNWDGDANYNSLQISVNKRMGKALNFGAAYTRSKALATSSSDGQWTNIINPKEYNYTLASWDRPNVLAINYDYNLPKFSKFLGNSKVVSYLLDGFQYEGIGQFLSGPPATVGGNFGWYGGQFLTGSWTEPANFQVTGNPNAPSGDPYGHVNPYAYSMPQIGLPQPWSQNYIRTGGTNRWDMSVFKNIPLGSNEQRSLQLRLEAFNVFNHPQFYGMNLGATPNNDSNYWDWAWNYSSASPVPSANIRPTGKVGNVGQYFGEYNGSGDERVVQLGVKLYF